MKVQQILDLIDTRDMSLPEFQRGYVWNREQVRGFFTSLYRGYPVGGFLVWHTFTGGATQRGETPSEEGKVKLLLDGQQRATTLYGVIRGKPPKFFEGNSQAFTGLHFNLHDEVFEFYTSSKMKGNDDWIDVTRLMQEGIGPYLSRIADGGDLSQLVQRLNQICMIKEKSIHLEDVTGSDKTIDVVVDIFNRVNSGGTKLSKGDLALAKICAAWPEARRSMNKALAEWQGAGFDFSLDWLLRVMNAVATGKVPFNAMGALTPDQLKDAFERAKKYVSSWLDVISGRLGLDHDRVLFGRFALVVLARYQHLNGGAMPSAREQEKLLYWYIHAGMWGRFAGSTETVLAQDLDAITTGGVDKLIDVLRLSRGDLTLRPEDFSGSSMGARFYPTLYMLTRTLGARDFDTGVVLSKALLGHLSSLEVHHIFPKVLLYAAGFDRSEVNALANFCFLTKGSNLKISDSRPEEYMPLVESKLPGALASQWIPPDRRLWSLDRYTDFLAARRRLLATATNQLLSSLLTGEAEMGDVSMHAATGAPAGVADDERSEEVREVVELLESSGFTTPQRDTEVAHPETGTVLSIAEAFWPTGLQPGQGQPVILELDEDEFDESALASLGYLVFTTTESLLDYAAGLGGLEMAEAAGSAAVGSAHDLEQQPDQVETNGGNLRGRFNIAVKDIYVRAQQEAGYNATGLLRMIAECGGLATAQRLLVSPKVSGGFVALWERGRLDLTVENLVLRPEFETLFSDEERARAGERLKEYGYEGRSDEGVRDGPGMAHAR